MSTATARSSPTAAGWTRDGDGELTMIPIDRIRLDPATQMRSALDEPTIETYAEAMRSGDRFPPVVLFDDGKAACLWMADGAHRVHAAIRAGLGSIEADVRRGTKRDAILHAAGANARHGLPRSNADKRRAVSAILDDPEWGQLPNREIARRTGTTHTFVGEVRWEREGRPRDPATKKRSNGPEVEAASTRPGERSGSGFHPGAGRESGRDGGNHPQVTSRPEVSDDPSSPDFDEPPNIQAETTRGVEGASTPPATDDPPDVAEGRRNGTIPINAKVQVTEVGPASRKGLPPVEEWEWHETEGTDGPVDPPAELTDEEYLAECPARDHLAPHVRKRFDAEALAYRAADTLRREFGEKLAPILKRLDREVKHIGPWRHRVRWFLTLNDPKRWGACKDCQGTGTIELIGQCPACKGEGYRLF